MTDVVTSQSAQMLRSYVNRIERLTLEIEAGKDDRKEVYAEAKGHGFDTKIMRMLIRIREMGEDKYYEQQAVLDTYLFAMKVPEAVADTVREAHRAMHETTTPPPAVIEGGVDDLYDRAVEVVTNGGKASTSYVQRRLEIGYNRAAALVERMEQLGVVSAPDHRGLRQILTGAPSH